MHLVVSVQRDIEICNYANIIISSSFTTRIATTKPHFLRHETYDHFLRHETYDQG